MSFCLNSFMIKKCTTCQQEKEITEFSRKAEGRGGYASICRDCKRKYDIEYREKNKQKLIEKRLNNKEKIKEWNEDWKKRNLDYYSNYKKENELKIKEKHREYYNNNKDKIKSYYESRRAELLEYKKEHRKKNKQKYSENDKRYRENNKEELKISKYEYKKERLKTNIEFKIKENLRNRVKSAIKYKSGDKAYKTIVLIGCEVKYLINHLESKFLEGMSWDNYGLHGWHIDHIIPCAFFDLTDPEEQKKCFHYTNLQPLWAKDNIAKGKKII
jgi:hypothetical protein